MIYELELSSVSAEVFRIHVHVERDLVLIAESRSIA